MSLSRRALLGAAGSAAAAAAMQVVPSSPAFAQRTGPTPASLGKGPGRVKLGVSSYSYWHFRPQDQPYPIEKVIEHAASVGVEGVDILHRQMQGEDNAYLQRLKKHAFVNGIDLIALSIHQGFVFPDAAERQKNIDHTVHCMELAYAMGIPCLRLNTGRWNTTKSFDDLMANRGIEPVLPGATEDQGFDWVISSIEKLLPTAEKLGVRPGAREPLGAGSHRRRPDAHRRCRQLAVARRAGRHRQLPGRPVRAVREDCAQDRASCRPRPTRAAASGTRSTSTTRGSRRSSRRSSTAVTCRWNSRERRPAEQAVPKAVAQLRAAFKV